jgi:hypothetical protein
VRPSNRPDRLATANAAARRKPKTEAASHTDPVDSRNYELDALDLDVIKLALRHDIDLKQYVPEVMRLRAKLNIREPAWLKDCRRGRACRGEPRKLANAAALTHRSDPPLSS